MRETRDFREGLILLPRLPSPARRATFRTSLASLAHAASAREPVPLEGLDPDALLAGVQAAMSDSLLDNLDWLSTPSAVVALWEIANALPMGPERRELGRRVVRHLHDGDAATFIAIATSLALGARKGLKGRGVRARMSLAFELPTTEAEGNETLALALMSRSDLSREFLVGPARGNLPARRFAATLLERAAVAAARTAMQEQPEGLRVFATEENAATFRKLLADRAPRVHQPAARARGVLSTVLPDLALEVRRDLDNERDPVARRRGLISLAASIAIDTEPAAEVVRTLQTANERGLFAAAAAGVRRAVEVEAEACRPILDEVARGGGPDAIDALIDVDLAIGGDAFPSAFAIARTRVAEMLATKTDDVGRVAWLEALARDLLPAPSLRRRVRTALSTFATRGLTAAYEEATSLTALVEERLEQLSAIDDSTEDGRRRAFHLVRELDHGVLDLALLGDLLALRIRTEEEDVDLGFEAWLDRLSGWLCAREERGTATDELRSNGTSRATQLGALVHLADLDGGDGPDATDRTRGRRLRLFRMLLARARADRASPFRGAVLEALARACDAIVRDEGSEVCDVVIALAVDLDDPAELEEVAAASVVSELRNSLSVYAELLRAARKGVTSLSGAHAFVATLLSRTREMPSASSPRLEAFRSALQRFGHAVAAVLTATSLGELRDEGGSALLPRVANAVQAIAQLVSGARRRRGDRVERAVPMSGATIAMLDALLERRLNGESVDLLRAVEIATNALREEVPSAIAVVGAFALRHASMLPDRPSSVEDLGSLPSISIIPARRTPLPTWMPPRRTLGGFYILHPLGEGGAASVFVVKRVDERFDDRAEKFALKVPAYTGAVARTLSEEDFLRMFREEASALLALPHHHNLARFVTFDSGLKPKPILVMEYVEGPTLARVLERKKLTFERALAILDGVAAGLEAMHAGGLAHLDLKPSNVILPKGPNERPVLVDFGLAGRTLRPGCATLEYGAPEVWGLVEHTTLPTAADVYAFGALAYEVLTADTLFTGNDDVAVLSAHALHDGKPEGLAKLPADVAKILSTALRRDPKARATMTELRKELASLRGASRSWPVRV